MPPRRRRSLLHAFGLHIADVVVIGGDSGGHGVNAAARLQAAAERGAAGFLSTEAV
ncbi:hypothetical protein I6F11_01380 [Ensifer sp. NBAIM29]|nr:hypothetical protein [Ensifer sp. NBAIM29]